MRADFDLSEWKSFVKSGVALHAEEKQDRAWNYFFFWCSYVFICKHTENISAVFYIQPYYWREWDQAVHTNFLERNYGLIELNGKTSVDFKQSRISALVFGGKGLFFFSS